MANKRYFGAIILSAVIIGLCLVAAKLGCERTVEHEKSNVIESLVVQPIHLSDHSNWSPSRFFDDPKVIELCYAMERSDRPAVERLLAEGVDINARGKKNMTPLMWCYFPLLNVELIEVHWKYRRGLTIGSRFSSEDYSEWKEESLQLLDKYAADLENWLELGADPTIPLSETVSPPQGLDCHYRSGNTMCDLAVWNPWGNHFSKEFTVFPILLNYMKDVDRPIHIPYGKVGQYDQPRITVMFYVVYPWQYNGMVAAPIIPKNLALLIEAGADIEYEGPNHWTPLIAAAKGHNYDMVYMLLCAGANRQQESSDGETLLSCLAESTEFYSGRNVGLVKRRLDSLAEAEAKSEGREAGPDEWKMVPLENSRLSKVAYFLKVIDWLSEQEPSWREDLGKIKAEVKAVYRDELQIDIEQLEYDPFPEEWGNQRQANKPMD